MKPNYLWLLLGIAVMLYALSRVTQEPAAPAPSTTAIDDSSRPGSEGTASLAHLEQRILMLEQRLQALQSGAAEIDPSTAEMLAGLSERVELLERHNPQDGSTAGPVIESLAGKRTEFLDAKEPGGSAAMADDLRRAFENDGIPEPALQVELENAEYLFDSPRVDALAYREMDCRENYCRLGYEDQSGDAAEAALVENELFLLLTQKYGDNITIHAGERSGSYRSVYIELAD